MMAANVRAVRSVRFSSAATESREAIGLVNVDNPIPGEAINEIRAIPAVRLMRVIEL